MSMNDRLSDMLSRIRNGLQAGHATVTCPASGLLENVLKVLEEEGYIKAFSRVAAEDKGFEELKIELKYFEGKPAISILRRVSKPGRRVYFSTDNLAHNKFFSGLGAYIISSSKGVLSSHDALAKNVGGEVLCEVF